MYMQLQVVDAIRHAGTDDKVQGLMLIIGDSQQFAGPAQVQELRDAVHAFR